MIIYQNQLFAEIVIRTKLDMVAWNFESKKEAMKLKIAIIGILAYYNMYTTTAEIQYVPVPPEPYETFDETTAY